MENHDAFTALMNAGMGWGAVVVGLFYIMPGTYFLLAVGLFSIIFCLLVGAYFYWNYRKTHQKSDLLEIGRKPSVVPLTPDVVEPTEPKKVKSKLWIFVKNTFFIVLGIAESAYFLSFIFSWKIVTIPVEGVNIPVLTYYNGFLVVMFVLGLYLAVLVGSRLRHPKKVFFEE